MDKLTFVLLKEGIYQNMAKLKRQEIKSHRDYMQRLTFVLLKEGIYFRLKKKK